MGRHSSWRASRSCRRSPTPGRSSASGSTTAPTPRSRARAARDAHDLRQVRQRAGRARGEGGAAHVRAQGGLRGRGGVRDRPSAARTCPRPSARATWPATCCSTTSRRATSSSRRPQWMPGKVFDGAAPCGPALVTPDEAGPTRRDRDRADAERRADAAWDDRGPGALGPGAGGAPVLADDAGARRHRLHRHPGRRRQPARAAGVAEGRRRGRDQLAPAGRATRPCSPESGSGRLDLAATTSRARRWPRPGGRQLRCADQMATLGSGPRHRSLRPQAYRRPCAARAGRPGHRLVAAALELLGQADDPAQDAQARAVALALQARPVPTASGSPLRCQRAISAISSTSRGSKPGRPAFRIR